MCTVNITNSTGSPLTYSNQSITHGLFETGPSSVATSATGGFVAESSWDDASDGCQGTVTYSLTDGTLFIVNYYTSYYYGPADKSAYSGTFQGPLANSYSAKTTSSSQSSNGGAGKRVTVTIIASTA
jgi:hypothetical protein